MMQILRYVLALIFLLAFASCKKEAESKKEGADMDRVRQVIIDNKNAVYQCYAAAIEQKPGTKGKILLGIEFDKEGKLSKTSILESSFASKSPLHACILQATYSWDFPQLPKAEKTRLVKFPFDFATKAQAK